jgi:two-component system response regulator YesN
LARILIADDDPNVRSVIRAFLAKAGIQEVVLAMNGPTALRQLHTTRFDIALLDLRMPPPNGLEILRQIHLKKIQTDVVMFSGYGTIRDGIEAVRLGARDFLEKPLDFKELLRLVRDILNERHPTLHPLAREMDDYLRSHASENSLDAARFATYFDVSTAYVRRLFRDHIGQPFGRRLTQHRVHVAKLMIKSTRESLRSIAERSGFKHQNRLTESFRRTEGITPSEYRKSVSRGGNSSSYREDG